jgi:hypothetical protein
MKILTDEQWINEIMTPDNNQLHDFIERVGIILDAIETPTDEQLQAARNMAFLEIM